MFNNKSNYALNKNTNNAIVYTSPTGPILLSRSDFESEEEFLKWKAWSDNDYHAEEQMTKLIDDYSVPYPEDFSLRVSAPSVEECFFMSTNDSDSETTSSDLILQVKHKLTDKQFRRLWMYYVDHLNEQEIGVLEHCGQQRISKSISSAKKIIHKFFKNRG